MFLRTGCSGQAEVERRCEMERAMMHKEELLERTLCQLAEAREATNQNHVASKARPPVWLSFVNR